jgi:glycosyltransferase EpsF
VTQSAGAKNQNAVRILHIVESLDDQAVENWLLRILRHANKSGRAFHWTFYTTLTRPGKHDALAREMGADVIHAAAPMSNTREFMADIRRTVKAGRFDVLHAHHDVVSAVYLLAVMGTDLKKTVVHIHNTAMFLPVGSEWKRKLLTKPLRSVCMRLADTRAGISRDALQSMLGALRPRPGKDVVVYYGIDTLRFHGGPEKREAVRRSLGIMPDEKVMLFGGRMIPYKNPVFVVEMLKHLIDVVPSIRAVFAGTGEDEKTVADRAAELGLSDRVRILGWRQDLPDLMAAADILIWPGVENPKEGLGLGIVEAQAAGLPIIMSRSVPDDAIVIPEIVTVLPLADGPQVWANEAARRLGGDQLDRKTALRLVEESPFSLEAGTRNVFDLYSLPDRHPA